MFGNKLPFRVLVVLTKADKVTATEHILFCIGSIYFCCGTQYSTLLKVERVEWEQRSNELRVAFDLPDEMPILFSSMTGEGKREIWKYIQEAISDNVSPSKNQQGKNSKTVMGP